jgi:hypothetical protein
MEDELRKNVALMGNAYISIEEPEGKRTLG